VLSFCIVYCVATHSTTIIVVIINLESSREGLGPSEAFDGMTRGGGDDISTVDGTGGEGGSAGSIWSTTTTWLAVCTHSWNSVR
jgi:hypothetical protein